MNFKKLFITLIFSAILLNSCHDPASIDDRVQEISDFPEIFEGLGYDIIFVADGVITRYDKTIHERVSYPTDLVNHKVDKIRVSPDGKYVYFIDLPNGLDTSGELLRLNLESSVVSKNNPSVISRDFRFLTESVIQKSGSSELCGYTFILQNIKNGTKHYLCEALEPLFEELEINTLYGKTYNIRHDSDGFFTYFRENNFESDLRSTHYKITLELTDQNLIVTAIDSLFSSPQFNTVTNETARYYLYKSNSGLTITDRETNAKQVIDPTDRILSFGFHDKYVIVKKRREYSQEFYLHDGYHIYDIETGHYFQLFPESLGMNALRLSPDGSKILANARFVDNNKWQVVVMNVDGSNPAIISDRSKNNVMPRFRFQE